MIDVSEFDSCEVTGFCKMELDNVANWSFFNRSRRSINLHTCSLYVNRSTYYRLCLDVLFGSELKLAIQRLNAIMFNGAFGVNAASDPFLKSCGSL